MMGTVILSLASHLLPVQNYYFRCIGMIDCNSYFSKNKKNGIGPLKSTGGNWYFLN